MIMSNIILAFFSRFLFVIAQFAILWFYTASFSITDLSSYNIATTLALILNTLICQPFDIVLQKRFTRRLNQLSDISTLQIWYLSILFISLMAFVAYFLLQQNNNTETQNILLAVLLCGSSYLSHSSKTLYLNSGRIFIYNIIVILESTFKVFPLFLLYYFENLTLFNFIITLVAIQLATAVFFLIHNAKGIKLRKYKMILKSFNGNFVQRSVGNSFHWTVTNLFRLLLIGSTREDLIAMGLTCFAIGCSISQSINSIINQFYYPRIYKNKGEGFKPFCHFILVVNLCAAAVLIYINPLIFEWLLPTHFLGYEHFIILGLITEMFNGLLGPLGIVANFRDEDKKLKATYFVAALLSIALVIPLVVLQKWDLMFIVPAVCLFMIYIYYYRELLNET